jgi:hypothetical protein
VNVLRAVACTLLCALPAACAAPAPQSVTPRIPSTARTGAITPLIYLFDGRIPPAAIDEVPIAGGRPVAQIRDGLTAPAAAILDKSGKLYVINNTGAQFQILEYPSGAVSPSATITVGIGIPGGITVGPKGELYVLNQGGPLVMYAAGSTTPAYATYRGICRPGSPATYALTVDPYDTLYALTMCTKNAVIQEYDNGLPHVSRTIQMPASEVPIGITADKRGTLYVTYFDASQSFRLGVAEYARKSTASSTQFDFGPVPKTGSGGTSPVVDEVTGRLYTTFGICTQMSPGPWHCAGYVYGFRRGMKKPVVTITAPRLRVFSSPVFDASGNLFVETNGPTSPFDSIWRYTASGTNKTRLVRSRLLGLIDIWPDADSPAIAQYSGVTGFGPACHSTPMSQSSPRSFLANERNAMSVSVLMMPSRAATCSVTRSFSCSCSFTRAMATRSNGPATE